MTAPADTAASHRKNTLIAILLTCVAYAYFNIGDAAVKLLAAKFHFSQIIVFQCLVIIAFMVTHGALTVGRGAFRVRNWRLVVARAALSVTVSISTIYVLPHVQLTTFYTLMFTSPFWVTLLSAYFLGEKLEKSRIAIILFGFGIILFIFRPGGGLFSFWMLLVLLNTFLYSCTLIIMRKLGPQESRTMIICSGSALSTLVSLPFLPFNFIEPTLYEWFLFVMLGVLGAVGVMCIAYAFQNAPKASVIAPFHYTQIVWGALLGYFIFNEVPDERTIMGAFAIIAAGLLLIYWESRPRKAVEKEARAELGT